jgi:hypothetical protein
MNPNQLQREMEAFKNFLGTKGCKLSKTSEFLSYYALPYIPNPHVHCNLSLEFTILGASFFFRNLHNRMGFRSA